MEDQSSQNRRVFVGNLAWRVRWQDLKDHMKRVGDVQYAEIITQGGRSKGCGIVEYSDADGARRAIEELNNTSLFDRKMFVRVDKEAGSPAAGGPFRGEYREAVRVPPVTEETAGRQLYVTNLPWAVSRNELSDLFGGEEVVERAEVATERDGRSKGFGCVICKTPEQAEEAVTKMNGYDLNGRTLVVKVDNGPPSKM